MKYDIFISHASEDNEFAEKLAKLLKNKALDVWLDKWELKPGDHLIQRLNDGIQQSKKIIAVFSPAYFSEKKEGWTLAEAASQLLPDILVKKSRRLIPLILKKCDIPPLYNNIISIDFTNPSDFEIKFQFLIQALDVKSHSFGEQSKFSQHDLPEHLSLGQHNLFRNAVKELYELKGYTIENDPNNPDSLIMTIQDFGVQYTALVKCHEKQIASTECIQLIKLKKNSKHQGLIVVSPEGFHLDTLPLLQEKQISCLTYDQLLYELFPLDTYAKQLMQRYEKLVISKWQGKDCYIRPNIEIDVIYKKRPALNHFAEWMDDNSAPFLVILGDLGTGKTSLSEFISYHLSRSFIDDPFRHPAPVLIPLKDVRKEISLEGIIVSHFSRYGLSNINVKRFFHLLNTGKIILFFDAFDEMADRVQWDITRSNFIELRRAPKTFRN